jgi:TPR repeat protein
MSAAFAAAPAETPSGGSDAELPAIVIPIQVSFEPGSREAMQQSGYYQPVAPQPYKRRCGTIATDVCPTDVAVPPGATGEQVYQMAMNANSNGQKGQAIAYLQKSAEMGYPKGEWAIGIDYLKGVGVRHDLQQAVHWLSLSADAGFRAGQYQMGDMYERGEGVPQDGARAIQMYKLAAAQHSADAEFALGLDYEFGKNVGHNRQLAIQYLRESSRDGTNTIGNDLANALAKAPATMRFASLEDIGAYLHPPHKLTAQDRARCGTEYNFHAGYGGTLQISDYCQRHFGCPYTIGATEYTCVTPQVQRIYP